MNLAGKRKLLDQGGGAASYSTAFCAANPQLRAVVVDQEEPLALARELVDEQGLGDRISLLQGDFNTVELERDFDVVLISGVVLVKPPEQCRFQFRRAIDALVAGGLMIVQDFMRVDHSPQRQFMDILMDLYVLIAFDPGAGDRDGQKVADWLETAGFENTRLVPLPTHLALVLADKPAAPTLEGRGAHFCSEAAAVGVLAGPFADGLPGFAQVVENGRSPFAQNLVSFP